MEKNKIMRQRMLGRNRIYQSLKIFLLIKKVVRNCVILFLSLIIFILLLLFWFCCNLIFFTFNFVNVPCYSLFLHFYFFPLIQLTFTTLYINFLCKKDKESQLWIFLRCFQMSFTSLTTFGLRHTLARLPFHTHNSSFPSPILICFTGQHQRPHHLRVIPMCIHSHTPARRHTQTIARSRLFIHSSGLGIQFARRFAPLFTWDLSYFSCW